MTFTVKFFVGLGLFFFILTALAILDIARKDFGSMAKKGVWAVIALAPFIGCLLYFAIGFHMGKVIQPGAAMEKTSADQN